MRIVRKIRVLCVIMGFLFVLLGSVFIQSAFTDEQTMTIVIIGNNNIPQNTLSKTDIQNIFLGKKTKLGGTKITFVILKSGNVHESFLKEYLARTPSQYNKYWKKMIFTGKGKAPKVFETEEALVEYVKATEGAIGYIGSETAQTIESDSLQQITVQ